MPPNCVCAVMALPLIVPSFIRSGLPVGVKSIELPAVE
jgi:hypothetical protein